MTPQPDRGDHLQGVSPIEKLLPTRSRPYHYPLLLTFGVFIPSATLIAELFRVLFAGMPLDLASVAVHMPLTLLIPLTNFLAWRALTQIELQRPTLLIGLIGVAIGIAGWYSLHFLSQLPASMIGVLLLGRGLHLLTPLIGLIALLLLLAKLHTRLTDSPRGWAVVITLGLCITALLIADPPWGEHSVAGVNLNPAVNRPTFS